MTTQRRSAAGDIYQAPDGTLWRLFNGRWIRGIQGPDGNFVWRTPNPGPGEGPASLPGDSTFLHSTEDPGATGPVGGSMPQPGGGGVGRSLGPPMDDPDMDDTDREIMQVYQEGHVTREQVIERLSGKYPRAQIDEMLDMADQADRGGITPSAGPGPIPTAQPGPAEGGGRTRKGLWGLFGTEGPVQASDKQFGIPGMGGPGSLESDRAIELRDILAQMSDSNPATGGMGGMGGGGSLPYNTGGMGGDPGSLDLGETGATNPWEQQGLSDMLRGIVTGGGVTPGFQGLEFNRLERFNLPFMVQQAMTGGDMETPSLFRQYLASQAGAGSSPQLGSALAQAGNFLGQDVAVGSLQDRAQLDIRQMLQSMTEGAVGNQLLAPILAIIGQGRGRHFGVDQGASMARVLGDRLSQDPSAYTSSEQFIQALQQEGILEWLNRRF